MKHMITLFLACCIVTSGVAKKKYEDTTFGYRFVLPSWASVKEATEKNTWQAYIEAEKIQSNYISISGFHKWDYDDFEHFQRQFVIGNSFAKPLIEDERKTYYGKEIVDTTKSNKAIYDIFYFESSFYHCRYILFETQKSYIVVRYIAGRDHFKLALAEFNEFMRDFEVFSTMDE